MSQAAVNTDNAVDNAQLSADLCDKARAMIPDLRGRVDEAAQLGKLPAASVEEMINNGFFRIMQPARYGGFELPPKSFFDVQMILAEGCMSTAWVLGVVAIHNWQLGLFDDQAQKDVWGENAERGDTLISSSYMPVGKVTRVDGGYKLSGHWGFSSGSKHCDWAFLGAMVPSEKVGEAPDYCTFLVPRSDYEIVDNWNVSGLEGTGSHDIIVKDALVPAYRTHRMIDGFNCDNPGNQVNTNPVFRLPFGQVFVRAVCTSSIGALQGALNAFIDVNKSRVGLNDGKAVVSDPGTTQTAADAVRAIDECKTIMYRNFDIMLEAAANGEVVDVDTRIKMRYDSAQVADKCATVINEMFIYSGAQGIFKDHPINRSWLDINAGRTHVANNIGRFGRNLGANLFGMENEDFFL